MNGVPSVSKYFGATRFTFTRRRSSGFSEKPLTSMNWLPPVPEIGVIAASVAERTPAIEAIRSSTCRFNGPICAGV